MTPARVLSADDIAFIELVASRRFGGGSDGRGPGRAGLIDGTTEFARAAAAARQVMPAAGPQAALLAMLCQLALDGQQLLSPQGAVTGMIAGVRNGGDPDVLVRWLQDRCIPLDPG